MVVYEIGSGMP